MSRFIPFTKQIFEDMAIRHPGFTQEAVLDGINECIGAGVVFLDKQFPEWEHRINLNQLSMVKGRAIFIRRGHEIEADPACIMCQLDGLQKLESGCDGEVATGSYSSLVTKLLDHNRPQGWNLGLSIIPFGHPERNTHPWGLLVWHQMDILWTKQILSLRNQ